MTVLIKALMINFFLPLFLILGAVLRPSFISLGYILLALLCSVLPSIRTNAPFPKTIYGYTLFCLAASLVTSLIQFGYQLYQHIHIPDDESYQAICNSSALDYWFRQVGLIRIPLTSDIIVLRLFLPEVFALLGSLITFIVCTTYPTNIPSFGFEDCQPLEEQQNQQETELAGTETAPVPSAPESCSRENNAEVFAIASRRVSDALIVFFTCFVGILNPSLLNLPYFLFFLITFTWWALYTPLRRQKFNLMKQFFLLYLAIHFMAIFAYQIEFSQKMLPPHTFIARLLDLKALVLPSGCSDWFALDVNFQIGWLPLLNFAGLLALYCFLTIQYLWTRDGVNGRRRLTAFVPARSTVESSVGAQRMPEDSTQEELLQVNVDSVDMIALHRITSEVLDRQKINRLIKSRRKSQPGSLLIEVAQEFLYFCLYHCYVFALLSMMMWALLYHSVFGLIFLVLTCFLWALANSRHWIFRLAPLILAYVEFLLMAQYVFSMVDLEELRTSKVMETIGFHLEVDRMTAFRTLLLKTLLSIPFFVLLRLYLREDYYNSLSARDRLKHINYGTFDDTFTSEHQCSPRGPKFPAGFHVSDGSPFVYISNQLTKYWIFLVVFFILVNSPLISNSNLVSIGFFGFFVSLLLIFQLSFRLFRRTIFAFLTLLIIYSSVVLVVIYCYQFPGVPAEFKYLTGFTDQIFEDIGLQKYKGNEFGELFQNLIKLISLIVVTMLQLKFFHNPWSKLVKSPTSASHADIDEPDVNRVDIRSYIMKAVDYWNGFKEMLWRYAEVHLYKFTLFVLLLICLSHFCLLNFFPIIFISAALCLTSILPLVTFTLCGYLALVFIGRSVYRLHFVPAIGDFSFHEGNCSGQRTRDVDVFNTTSKWIGLEKDSDDWLFADILGFLVVLLLIGIQYCVKYRQSTIRKFNNQSEPQHGIIFPSTHPKDFDKSLTECVKFFINYGFYKFGVEVSFSAMAFAAWARMDGLSALLMVWLLALLLQSRTGRKRMWPFLVIYLAILLPLQYAMAIGLPENLCIGYPWDAWTPLLIFHENDFVKDSWKFLNDNLSYFLSLANYRLEPQRFKANLIVDFLLLGIIAAQNYVFGREGENHPAGSNESIYKDAKYQLFKNNPHYDFVVEQKSFVDFFKYVIFMYGHWITMIMVLCAGLGGTSLFALGYVVLAFWMLWQGNNLYTMRSYPKTLAQWNMLSVYTTVVMFCKIGLQLLGCVFIDLLIFPWICSVQQLFSIFCTNKLAIHQLDNFFNENKDNVNVTSNFQHFQKCTKDPSAPSEASIGFDAIALLFIVFQLRIFHSWFFQHSMIEFCCEVIQANRGAILINQLVEKEMREQTEQQNKKLREIKERTAAIRKRYEEQQKRTSGFGSMFFSPETYGQAAAQRSSFPATERPPSVIDVDDPLPSYDPRYAVTTPLPAKRAGDYYMFDYDPETDELVKPVESFVPEVTPGAGDFDKLDPVQLFHTALGKDLNLIGTLDSVEEAEHIKDEKLRMIAAIAPSQKAREIARKALYHRQHPEQQAGSELLHTVEELEETPSTSKISRKDEEEAETTDDIPSIRFRKKKSSSKEDEPAEIQPATEGETGTAKEETAKNKKPDNWRRTTASFFRFGWKILISILDWIAAFLNRRSREHRYVAYVLNKEKEHLKTMMNDDLYDGRVSSGDLRDRWESHNMHMVSSEADIQRLENEAHNRWEERNVFARFITAVGNGICAHTDVICYAFAIFVHGWTAGLITMPLPALVFFWGTLSNPRPSKFFWVTMIIYTELEIVIKFAFQFGFWPWNQVENETKDSYEVYKKQYLLGIQRVPYFAVVDVALLIALFFHRYMLRKLGLWRDANSDRLLDTPTSSPAHSKENGHSKENSPKKKGNGSSGTESTTLEVRAHEQEELDVHDVDIESGEGRQRLNTLPQVAEEMPPSGQPGTTTAPLPQSISKLSVFGNFIEKLIYPKFRYIRDFYPLMFFLDIFCMLIVAFGYSSFGEGGTGDVVSDIKSNRIPITLVVILLIQSLMIVLDRGLYLRKAVIAKLIYHLLTIVIIHVWIFYTLPGLTKKEAYYNSLARILYYVKCVYFLIAAWQIRNGYPSLCIGNLLTHSYGLVNMVLFKIFMLTPFVFEVRTAIDWTWTDTSMPIFDFFNMENFYATIYNLKCARKFEDAFPAPRGESKGPVIKYLMGIPLILIMILLIWSPIILFAFLNTIGNISAPESAVMTVSLEGFPPLYRMEAKGSGIERISSKDYETLKDNFSSVQGRENELSSDLVERMRMAAAFISQYTAQDILRVKFRPESESFWEISTDSLTALRELLHKNKTDNALHLSFTFQFTRPREDSNKEPQVHSFTRTAEINSTDLLTAINNSTHWFHVMNVLPTYMVIPSEGEIQVAKMLHRLAERRSSQGDKPKIESTFNHWEMKLLNDTTATAPYWISQMVFNDNITKLTSIPSPEKVTYKTVDPDDKLNYTEFLTFVDRVFPSFLNNYVQGGIILMYAGIILIVGRFIRGFVSSQPLDVIINEIPNPDYLLKICLDIYLVREARDFILEQDLFAKLIFLFRSPQTLIRWTRYKAKPE